MRRPTGYIPTILAMCALALASSRANAGAVRILSADARGVTLQYTAEAWSLSAPDAAGLVHVTGVPGAFVLAEPGRGQLPAYSVLLAVPTNAHPTMRILATGPGQTREGVRIPIAPKRVIQGNALRGDAEPGIEVVPAILDGPWPAAPVQLGALSRFRGRALVALELHPYRYDASAARLSVTSAYTVRVDFNQPAGTSASLALAGGPDPGMDAALATTVLNFDQARAWRDAPAGARGGARALFPRRAGAASAMGFDEGQPEVRVKVDSTGLYVLSYDQLAAKGYPSAVPIAQVSVHRHEYLEGQVPPYGTVDVPVDVDDVNGNGVFDSGDLIWMYARTWAARSGASRYQRWWGDAEVVYVTQRASGGARMATRDGWRGQTGLTPPVSYPATHHYENNGAIIMPFIATESDTNVDVFQWTSFSQYFNRPDTILFAANDIDTTHAVQIGLDWVGRAFADHTEWAAVRGGAGQVTSIVDSLFWTGKEPVSAAVTLHGSALTEGGNNALRIWGKPGVVTPTTNTIDAAGMNSFDVSYWRRYRALNDMLEFNSADATGEIQLHCDGFRADTCRIYDVTNPEQPVRILLADSHFARGGPTLPFDMQDSVAAGSPHAYVAAVIQDPWDPTHGPRVPPDANVTAVNPHSVYANLAGDYLVVAPEAFVPSLQPLVDLRTRQGLRVVVASAEAVYDEFNGGRHSAAAIQRFVAYAYDHWSARFLLLGGDGTIDPLNNSGLSGVDEIPVLPSPGPVTTGDGYEIVPSDNRYGCLTGNCDPITGIGIVVPEMMIGRLPANTVADMQAMVAKIVNYEDLSGDVSWRRHVLLTADDAYSTQSTFADSPTSSGYCYRPWEMPFLHLNEKVQSVILHDAGLLQMNAELWPLRYYLPSQNSGDYVYTPGSPDTCRSDLPTFQNRTKALAKPALFSRLNSGVLWWNFQGHANEFVLTHEYLYLKTSDADDPGSDDKAYFTNDGKPFLFTAFSCHANMFARQNGRPNPLQLGSCIGEDMMTLPNRGAMASWASVCYEVVPGSDSSHVNVALARQLFEFPPTDEFVPGDRGARVVLGEVIQATLLSYVSAVQNNFLERGIGITYTLLGDPGSRLSIGKPQSVVYANDSLVTDGVAVRLHTPGDSLTLVADLLSTVRLDSLGLYENDGTGNVAVPASAYTLSPAFPDTAGGGVYGGHRFRLTYGTHDKPRTYDYLFRTIDRNGLETDFTVPFVLDATLRADGVALHDGDDVSPRANLTLVLVCPRPVVPGSDLVLEINGAPVAFTASPANGDASGREWILSWTHADYPKDSYVAVLTVQGQSTVTRRFTVSTANGELRVDGLFGFPNPFDNGGTTFSFTLEGTDPADVKVSIFTIAGRLIYSDIERSLAPGYHQIPWNGRDAEGSDIANGVYIYRLSAASGKAHVLKQGQLVKIRKPRHVDLPTGP